MRRRPTLEDVAVLANCSPSAVSLVVSGKAGGRISPEVADRVWAAIEKTSYRPHQAARSLATGISHTAALVVPDSANPYYAELVSGLADELPTDQSITLVVTGRDEPLGAVLARALAADPSALIVCSPASGTALQGVPLAQYTVVLDAPGIKSPGAHVDIDVQAAGRLAIEHLTAQGHRRIAWLGPNREVATFRQRLDAAQEAARAANGATLVADTLVTELHPDAAAQRFTEVWETWRAQGVTAVACADDLLAYGVLLAARQMSIGVPDELAVIGMGDLWNSRVTNPSLTSIDLNARGLGRAAAEALGSWRRTGTKPRRRSLPVSLIVRESTARQVLAPTLG